MNLMRYGTLPVASLLLLLVLSGCGGDGSAEGSEGLSAGKGPPVGRVESSGDTAASPAGGTLPGTSKSVSTSEALPNDYGQKIVKTAELGINSKHVRQSAADAQRIAASAGGSVLSPRVSEGSAPVSANLVLSVPSQEFEKTLDDLRSLGSKVTTDNVTGQDVTGEYVDLKSRERNLLAAEQSLLKLYDKAKSVEDTLTIQRELTNVRGEIELVQGRIKYLDNRTAFSQITLSIQPVPSPPPPKPAWSPLTVAAEAWSASLDVLQTLATALIAILAFGWWLLPLPIASYLWWRRRNVREPTVPGPSQ